MRWWLFLILTTAPSNGTATTGIRVSLSTWLAVVVARTPPRAWYSVPLQCSVAYVLWGCQDTAVGLGVHAKFIDVVHALGDGALAATTCRRRHPAQPVVVDAGGDGGAGDDQSCDEQPKRQQKRRGIGHCFLLLLLFSLQDSTHIYDTRILGRTKSGWQPIFKAVELQENGIVFVYIYRNTTWLEQRYMYLFLIYLLVSGFLV